MNIHVGKHGSFRSLMSVSRFCAIVLCLLPKHDYQIYLMSQNMAGMSINVLKCFCSCSMSLDNLCVQVTPGCQRSSWWLFHQFSSFSNPLRLDSSCRQSLFFLTTDNFLTMQAASVFRLLGSLCNERSCSAQALSSVFCRLSQYDQTNGLTLAPQVRRSVIISSWH